MPDFTVDSFSPPLLLLIATTRQNAYPVDNQVSVYKYLTVDTSKEAKSNLLLEKSKLKMEWKKFSGEALTLPILEEVEQAIIRETNEGYKLKVCIGTDSQVKGSTTDLATVIVLLRQHHGGFMFIHQEKTQIKMTIKERMLLEVQRSIETAYSICDLLDLYDVDLEVHADINTNPMFKSNKALNDAMGYILSMGFIFKAKPEAFASSACADKMVH